MSIVKIVSRWDTSIVLYECDVPDGIESDLRMRHALEAAIKSGADLSSAYLRGANLSGANLSGAYLRGAYLRGANLSSAYLRGANLSGANLRGANLSGAYLSGAELSGAYLSDADLRGADLRDADLSDADLRGADLSGAYLRGAERYTDEQTIANLDKVREIILDNRQRLFMGTWHAENSEWRTKSCAEEMLCGTTHCLAGWLQVCATDEKVRAMASEQLAGIVQAPVAAKMFFRQADEVIDWLQHRKYVAEIEEGNKRRAERAAAKERA